MNPLGGFLHGCPPRVHLSNVRWQLNGWHTGRRYQQTLNTRCCFCTNPEAQDSIEHFIFCPALQQCLPSRLKSGSPLAVSPPTWFLFCTLSEDKLLMALYIHAFYTLHNQYRHSQDRGELRLSVERIVFDIPLKRKLASFVKECVATG